MSNTYPSVPPKTLAVDLSSSDMTLKLTDIVDWGGADLTAAAFPTTYTPATLINDSGSLLEFILITSSTIINAASTGATIYKRGLKYYATGDITADQTEVTANKLQWTQGETKVLLGTHPPYLLSRFSNKDNAESILNAWTFAESQLPRASATHAYIGGEDLYFATKEYVDSVAIAGAPNASTTAKGLVQIATTTQAGAGTGTGSTGALLVVPTSMTNAVSSAAVLVPVTEADGDINVGFMQLDAAWNFTSTLNVATSSNWQLGGTAFTGTMAFVNIVTGGDSSNADNAHIHNPAAAFSTLFETAGRFTASTFGTASNTLGTSGVAQQTTAVSSAACEVVNPAQITNLFDRDFVATVCVKATTAAGANLRGSAYFLVADNVTFGTNVAAQTLNTNARHAGFAITWVDNTNLKLFCTWADGTTNQTFDASASVTETNVNFLTVRKNSSQLQFFANGTLLTSSSTNTPSGGLGELLRCSLHSSSSGSGTFDVLWGGASIEVF